MTSFQGHQSNVQGIEDLLMVVREHLAHWDLGVCRIEELYLKGVVKQLSNPKKLLFQIANIESIGLWVEQL